MALSGSVDFVITATDLTSKPTQDIVSALLRLDEAQKDIIDSTGSVAKSTADLKTEQEALLKIQGELDKRMSGITAYEKNEEKIKELTAALDIAKGKYSDFTTALFKAQESGGKTAIDTATSNLKAANTAVRETQTQLNRLTRAQEKLRTESLARGGVDLTQGGTARAVTAAAQETVNRQQQLNIQLQMYASEQAQEAAINAQTEARKQAQAKESAEFQAKLNAASDQNRRSEYARMYAALLDEQEASLKQIAEQERKAAEATALRAAEERKATEQLEKFQDVGRRANQALDISKAGPAALATPATSTSASSAVLAALDPLKSQLSTLAGVETALTEVEAKIKEVGTSSGTAATKIEGLTAQEKQLDQISKSLGSQAGFIDKLNTQNAAVDAARVKLDAAEAEVRKWANAIQQAAQPNDAMLQFLQQAQGRLQGATTSFNNQNVTLQRLRTEAQAAGVNVDKLATEEARLATVAQRTAAAQRTVGEALTSASNGGKDFLSFLDKYNRGGRTTLSFTQRLRGEVLSLAASYLGLQAAVRGVGAVLDAVNTSQSVKAQIAQTSDTPEEAKAQFDFLLNEAKRTSTSFKTVAEGYRTMVRQTREFGLSQAATNKLFSDALTVSRSYNQTQEQLQGTMLALGQIFDKGTIQAQEFKQQLSNAGLAGLFPVLQKVMRDQGIKSITELRKAMADGTISAANMNLVFDELARSGQKAFGANMNTWAAQVGRFQTQLFVLENKFADSGFLEGVSDGLERVSDLLAKPETQENIRKLGVLIGDLISGFLELATNTEVLSGLWTALEVFLAGKFIVTMLGVYRTFGLLSTATTGLVTVVPGLTKVFGATSKLGLWGAIVGTGIALGVLIDKIPGVQEELSRLANANFWDTYVERYKTMGRLAAAMTLLEKAVTLPGEALGEGLAQVTTAKSFWGDAEKADALARKNLEENTAALRKLNQERKAILDKGADATDADVARLKELTAQTQAVIDKINRISPPKVNFMTADQAKAPGSAAETSADQKALNEARLKALEEGSEAAAKTVLSIQKKTQEKQLKSQHDFLNFYRTQYQDQLKAVALSIENLEKLPATPEQQEALTKARKTQADLNLAIEKLADEDYRKLHEATAKKNLETTQAYEHRAVTLHEQTNALKLASDKQLAALGAKIEDDSLKARLAAVDAEIEQINQKYEVQLRKNSDAIAAGKKVGSDTSQLEADNATIRALQKELENRKHIAEVLATQKFTLDEAQKAEDAINTKLQLRSALLSAIEEQRKAGVISNGDAQQRTREVNTQTLGGATGIDALMTQAVANYDKAIREADPAATAYIQKLELARAQMIALKAATDASAASISQFAKDMGGFLAGAITSSLTALVDAVGKVGAGVQSIGKAWATARDAMRNAVADMLQQIAIYIIKLQIIKALQRASNSTGGIWGQVFGAAAGALGGGGSSAHTGAVVGAGGVGGATPRAINPAWFIGAPRFHGGGLPGLAPDEYPIIAQQGEEILSKDNPRNILNGGGRGGDVSQIGTPGGDVNVHMHADAGSFFSAGLNTKRGQKDFWLFVEANRSKFAKFVRG